MTMEAAMSTLPVLKTDIVLAYVSGAVSIVNYCATVKLQMVCFQRCAEMYRRSVYGALLVAMLVVCCVCAECGCV